MSGIKKGVEIRIQNVGQKTKSSIVAKSVKVLTSKAVTSIRRTLGYGMRQEDKAGQMHDHCDHILRQLEPAPVRQKRWHGGHLLVHFKRPTTGDQDESYRQVHDAACVVAAS